MKSFRIFVTSFLCLCGFSQGEAEERTCRIIFVDPSRDAPEEAHLFDGTTSRKVALPNMNLSETVNLPVGDLVLSLTPAHVSDPKELPEGAPTIEIPGSVADFFLILVDDPENKVLPVRMLPVEAGDERPEPGQTLWINLTRHAISGTLGEKSLDLPPKGRVVGVAPLSASGYYKAEFRYQPDGEGEFLPLMRKSWWFDSTSGNLGFVVDSGGRLPRIFTFRDSLARGTGKSEE